MKLGRTFAKVREAAGRAGVDGRAVYVERASSARERTAGLADVDPAGVPYMSLVLVPGDEPTRAAGAGSLDIVGLGPAGPGWLTPEAQAALARAEVLVGYETYLARVPPRRGQERRASDNHAELERARDALELALGGARVAVVSSGDPGIFAMAAAVSSATEPRARASVLAPCPCAWCRECPRCRSPLRAWARHSATTSASSRSPTSSSPGP
jgi:precorrin-2 C20-methyltransferase/precorrin-3B C17-methyltransferase